jgi:hypothetical protein
MEREILSLEVDVDVAATRAQEKEFGRLWKRDEIHRNLIELRAHEPSICLDQAVVLSSNEICGDCERFRRQVNDVLGLEIKMKWCT